MKKIFIGVAAGLSLGVLGCLLFYLFFSVELIPNDFASVVIKNESGKVIKKTLLKHIHGTIEDRHFLKNNEELRFLFKNTSENSYTITVTFDDDSTLTSDGMYIEYRDRTTEIVTRSKIITK